MATLTPVIKAQFFDSNGDPLVGGKLYSYEAGTDVPLATYTDSTGTQMNTNPIILNARGEANVWVGVDLYKFRLKTSTDVEIWTVDNVGGTVSPVEPTINTPTLTGNVYVTTALGIGTDTPAAALDVATGYAQISDGTAARSKWSADATASHISAEGVRAFTIDTNSTTRLTVSSAGDVDIVKALTVGEDITTSGAVITDTISEKIAGAGVTIDGVLCKDSQVDPANRVLTTGTAQNTVTGTVYEFLNIPSWVKRITVVFSDVSYNGPTGVDFLIQLGTVSGYETTLYAGGAMSAKTTGSAIYSSDNTFGFLVQAIEPGNRVHGVVTLVQYAPNLWCASGSFNLFNFTASGSMAGSKTMGGAVTRLRIAPNNVGATFDNGLINIIYE
jgi:hypothetical protein